MFLLGGRVLAIMSASCGVFLITAFNVVLQVGSSVASGVLQQVARNGHDVGVEGGILKLDEQLLALGL